MERDFARKQIARMAQMNRFPKTEIEALGELIDALMTAPSDEMARAIITGVLEDANSDTPCPTGSDIRKAILDRLRVELGEILPDPDCQLCNGIGFPIIERNGSSGAGDKCKCWARRHPPVYRKRPGDAAMSADFNKQLIAGAKALRGGK